MADVYAPPNMPRLTHLQVQELGRLDRTSLVSLVVRGRKTNTPYIVKIWFAVANDKIYVTSGRGSNASWVKNLRHKPEVELQIGTTTLYGTAVWLDEGTVEAEVLPLFFRKYLLARILGWIGVWYTEKFAFAITPVMSS